MEALLRKYLWVVDLLAVGLVAVFLGRAASHMVESRLLASIPLPKANPRTSRAETAPMYTRDFIEVAKRNMFCSTCPPLIEEPKSATVEKEQAPEPVKTTLTISLVAVNYAAGAMSFKYSFAVLRDTETKAAGAYSLGERVKGAIITGIDETRVHLDNAGKPEFLDLLDPEPEKTPTAAAPVAVAAAASDPLAAEMDKGIKKTGEHTYDIQRSTLESVLGNMNLLSRSARIVPEIRDGKAAGFRLYSVRPDGPFAKIGMQNGDVIAAINGLEITSPEKALEVYAKLKSASHLSVGLERNGQRITKDYGIR